MNIGVFLIGAYWVLIALVLVASGMIVYHIWFYYMNKALAILMIGLFLGVGFVLISANLTFASQVDWNIIFNF